MSEQITLFDEPLTPETLGDKLEEILEAAREKSGYYRLHESGMYEMMRASCMIYWKSGRANLATSAFILMVSST